MLEDSAPAVVLTHDASLGTVTGAASGVPVIQVDRDARLWAQAEDENLSAKEIELSPRNLAYVIYTSGSTGAPKGAMNEHRSVINGLMWLQQAHPLDQRDVVLQKTPMSFDVSVWEVFGSLAFGARLVMARPEGQKDPRYLIEVIRTERVSTLYIVPSLAQMLLEHGELEQCKSIVRIICSGEALSANLARRLHERLPSVDLYNLYGPTEAAVHVTSWKCIAGDPRPSIPIGRPIANTAIYVLDGRQQPAPIGVVGELYIGGRQVGRGYLNKPELTADRFLKDPFTGEADGRMYKTGDLGRWSPDGTVEYLGRNDYQVKVRGFRIELGEIEARLAEVEGVKEVVVVAREYEPGDTRLVAYYAGVGAPGIEILRERAREGLPEYMVPSAYARLEKLPLTPNGKINRKALPAPDGEAYLAREYEAPRGELELTLATLWADLLKVNPIGRNDNFFEVGGHSLVAVALIEKMRRAGMHADVRAVFTARTLAELAALVGGQSREVEVPPNLITAHATVITAEMLPLMKLDQAAIDIVVGKVPGGVPNVQDIYPLGPLQEGILFHHLMRSEGDTYLLPTLLGFGSKQAMDRFVETLRKVVKRHDILRTAIVWEGLDEPAQVVQREANLRQETVELIPRPGR